MASARSAEDVCTYPPLCNACTRPMQAHAHTEIEQPHALSLSLRATHSFTSRVHVFCRVCLTGGIKSHYSTVVTLLTEFSFLFFLPLLLLLLSASLFLVFERDTTRSNRITRRPLPLSKDFAGTGEDFRRNKPFRAVYPAVDAGIQCFEPDSRRPVNHLN